MVKTFLHCTLVYVHKISIHYTTQNVHVHQVYTNLKTKYGTLIFSTGDSNTTNVNNVWELDNKFINLDF